MNETERKAYLEQFNRRTHVLGRIVSAITLVLLVGAPFLLSGGCRSLYGKARMAAPCGLFTAYCAPPTGPDTAGRMLDAVR